jgi:hypothetical protein
MSTSDFESGRAVPLLIPEPIWREWTINGVDADELAELQAEHGDAVGYEFDWGQIIEEVFDENTAADSDNLEDLPSLEVRWHFVLRDVHAAFLDSAGNLGELSDLAVTILVEIERSRDELPEALQESALPVCISFDEGDDVSAFAVCVVGRFNVPLARQWMSSFFIPGVLPMIIDRLHAENKSALAAGTTSAARLVHSRDDQAN